MFSFLNYVQATEERTALAQVTNITFLASPRKRDENEKEKLAIAGGKYVAEQMTSLSHMLSSQQDNLLDAQAALRELEKASNLDSSAEKRAR